MHKLPTTLTLIVALTSVAGNALRAQNVDPFGPAADGDDPSGDSQPAEQAEEAVCVFASNSPTNATPTIIWASSDSTANEPVHKALRQPLTQAGLDFSETSLDKVVEFLRDEYQLPVHIDIPALDNLGLRPDEPINASYRNIRLDQALRLMLNQLELTAVPQDGCLLVTTEVEAKTKLLVAVYPVGDLVIKVGFDSLIDVIISTVKPETWRENGGGESDIRPYVTGMLIVSQTEAVHHEIVALLETMRRVPKSALIDPKDLPKEPAVNQVSGGGGGGGGFGFGGGGGGQFVVPPASNVGDTSDRQAD